MACVTPFFSFADVGTNVLSLSSLPFFSYSYCSGDSRRFPLSFFFPFSPVFRVWSECRGRRTESNTLSLLPPPRSPFHFSLRIFGGIKRLFSFSFLRLQRFDRREDNQSFSPFFLVLFPSFPFSFGERPKEGWGNRLGRALFFFFFFLRVSARRSMHDETARQGLLLPATTKVQCCLPGCLPLPFSVRGGEGGGGNPPPFPSPSDETGKQADPG